MNIYNMKGLTISSIHAMLLTSVVVCFHTSTRICINNYRTHLAMSRRSSYGSPSQDYPPPFRPSNYGNSYKRPSKEYYDNSGGRFQNKDRRIPRGPDDDMQYPQDNGASTRRPSDTKQPYQSSSRQRRFDSIRAASTPPPLRRRDNSVKIDPPLQQYVRPNQQRYNSNEDLLSRNEQQRQKPRRRANIDPMERNDKDPLVRHKNEGNFYSNSQTRARTRTTATTTTANNNNDSTAKRSNNDEKYYKGRSTNNEAVADSYKKPDDLPSKPSSGNNSDEKHYNKRSTNYEAVPDPYKKFDDVYNKPSTGIDKRYLVRLHT